MGKVSLPAIVSALPADVRNFLQRVREALQGGVITTSDLLDIGLVEGGPGGSVVPVESGVGSSAEVDYSTPPAPTGLSASGTITSIIVTWNQPSGYTNLAYTEVWRSSTNNIGTAVLSGLSDFTTYTDTVDPGSSYYYWIRFVSLAGVVGPYNSTTGTLGETSDDPGSIVSLLTAHGLYADTPYYYQSVEAVINGVTVPVGTYIRSAFIADGTITTAKIGSLAVTDAKIASLTVAKLTSGDFDGKYVNIGTGGNIRSGQTAFGTGVGFWMGKGSDGYVRFSLGNPSGSGIDFDQSTGVLNIRGTINLYPDSEIDGVSLNSYFSGAIQDAIDTGVDTQTGGMIVRDADLTRYAHFTGGDLTFYDYVNSGWVPYKSLTKDISGICYSGIPVNIGYFREQPSVQLTLHRTPIYRSDYSSQNQEYYLSVTNLRHVGTDWWFDPIAQLMLSSGSAYFITGFSEVVTTFPTNGSTLVTNGEVRTVTSSTQTFSVGVKSIECLATVRRHAVISLFGPAAFKVKAVSTLMYRVAGVWNAGPVSTLSSAYATNIIDSIKLEVSNSVDIERAYIVTEFTIYTTRTSTTVAEGLDNGMTFITTRCTYTAAILSYAGAAMYRAIG